MPFRTASIREDEAEAIKKLLGTALYTQAQVAELFEVPKHVISNIARGHTWKHLDGPRSRSRKKHPVHQVLKDEIFRLHTVERIHPTDIADKFDLDKRTIYRVLRDRRDEIEARRTENQASGFLDFIIKELNKKSKR